MILVDVLFKDPDPVTDKSQIPWIRIRNTAIKNQINSRIVETKAKIAVDRDCIQKHLSLAKKSIYIQCPPKNLPRSIYAISSIVHPNQT